jgi:predicted dehydrogenase
MREDGMKKEIRFGIIGCGLMGKEFASAVGRWFHLDEDLPKPVITAACDMNPAATGWFSANFPTVTLVTSDYRELLASGEVDAVYCAIPHNLHADVYVDIIEAGKHLLGEKPFGIDLAANARIMDAVGRHPEVLVRSSSEFPFAPAMQRICDMIEAREFGTIIEVEAGFIHSSDLDPGKPINWKRIVGANGEYGCMGDLGLHVCHVPFRAGWTPRNVRAILSKIVAERPDGKGGMAACETWDNATLLCEAEDPETGRLFPMTLKTQRIAPGETNTWSLSILGTKASARFSTKNINMLELLRYAPGGEQNWQAVDIGHRTTFKSVTGGIFEFGFSDSILQMWAAFLYEIANGAPKKRFAGCVTPGEPALSHRLFTAALESQKTAAVVPVRAP